MGMVFKFGSIVQNTKAIGLIIEHMGRDVFGMQMGINLKENFKMTSLMVKEYIHARMERYIKVNGLMMCNTDKGKHNGLTDPHLLDSIKKVKRKVLEATSGLVEINTEVNGKKI